MAGLLDGLFGQRAQMPGSAQSGGLLSNILAPEVALPMAAALMGNQGNMQNIGNAFALGGQQLAQTRGKNQTMEFFRQQAPEFAQMIDAGMPVQEAWQAYTKQRFAQPANNATDDMREYEMARQQGFEGSFMDFQVKMKEAGRNQVNIDTGVKLPSGYQWVDPENQGLGVKPIAGGPATQMPSELAARIGLAQDALTKLDAVEQSAAAGDLTGPVDYGMGQLGRGKQGQMNRELAAGAEALTRMLTGAGMNIAEAQREANLYLPQIQDDAATLANKVSQLKRRLQSTIEMAGRGRGLETPAPANDGWTDVGNGVRIRALP